jgi:hypothetical protein
VVNKFSLRVYEILYLYSNADLKIALFGDDVNRGVIIGNSYQMDPNRLVPIDE